MPIFSYAGSHKSIELEWTDLMNWKDKHAVKDYELRKHIMLTKALLFNFGERIYIERLRVEE